MGVKKHFGVVYTPGWTVDMMLERLPSLRGVAVCDPACGDGQFLVAIAERVCSAIRRSRSEAARRDYYRTLKCLTGMDIDGAALEQCRRRLNGVLRQYGCRRVDWQLHEADAIDRGAWAEMAGRYNAVVGNPPYIRIQHLEAHRRRRIGDGWRLMSGCSDMFILFFEMGLELLRPGGGLVFITPNSWMKSKSGAPLRECLRHCHRICHITDFGEHQVFKDATAYTAITHVRKGGPPQDTAYDDTASHVARQSTALSTPQDTANAQKCTGFKDGKPLLVEGRIDLQQRLWSVLTPADVRFINRIRRRRRCLGDVAEINVGIQTLADDVFIFRAGSVDIEKGITRPVVKASVMRNGSDTEQRAVIYPYDKRGKLIPEDRLKSRYPKAYDYLRRHKRRLLARDKGAIDRRKWYGYGREVAIRSGFGEKILTSPMNPSPDFQPCPDPDALFYSGYAVKPKPGISMAALLTELNSKEMDRYIRLVSKPYRNGWFSYAKSVIESFPVPESVMDSAAAP